MLAKPARVDAHSKKRAPTPLVRAHGNWAPQLEQLEALHVELDYFAKCIVNNETPFNDCHAGLRVVKMLEAAEASIRKRGELVRL